MEVFLDFYMIALRRLRQPYRAERLLDPETVSFRKTGNGLEMIKPDYDANS